MPRYELNQRVPLGASHVGVILHVYGGIYPATYEVEVRRADAPAAALTIERMVEDADGELVAVPVALAA